MRGRRSIGPKSDSLDLLLDTLCNAFGGIVLIALLLALVTRQARNQETTRASDFQTEVVQRMIQSLEREIAGARQLLSRPNGSPDGDDLAKLTKQYEDEKIRNAAAHARLEGTAGPGSRSADVDKLLAQIAGLTTQISTEARKQSALQEEIERQNERFVELSRRFADSPRALRLPKERSSGQDPLWIILRDNEMFARDVASEGDLSFNADAFNAVEEEGKLLLRPRASRGLRPNAIDSELSQTFRAMKSDGRYAAIMVDAKSVTAFRSLQRALIRNGISFGWGFNDDEVCIFVSEGGSRPPPL